MIKEKLYYKQDIVSRKVNRAKVQNAETFRIVEVVSGDFNRGLPLILKT